MVFGSGSSGLTQRGAAWPGASVGDLLAVGVHAPALSDAGVALRGLVGSVSVTLRDVLTDGRPRTEEREEAGARSGSLGALSVTLTQGLLVFCGQEVTIRVRHQQSVNKLNSWRSWRLHFTHG